MSSNTDENDPEKKSKKKKKKIELWPPLKKIEKSNEIIFLENKDIFPQVGKIGTNNHITYIGHPKPVIKLILIKTPTYPNHLCSLSVDGKIKLWNLSENITCIKNIETNFETWDIIYGNNNNIIACGEQIIIINLETEEKIIIKEKKAFKFVEFNLLAKINFDIGVCTSLNDYYLVFDINQGNIIKKIEMNKTHFICQMEKNQKIKKEEEEKKRKKNIDLEHDEIHNNKINNKTSNKEKEDKLENYWNRIYLLFFGIFIIFIVFILINYVNCNNNMNLQEIKDHTLIQQDKIEEKDINNSKTFGQIIEMINENENK